MNKASTDRIVESSAYLLFYRRRSDHTLGGPRLERIVGDFLKTMSEENTGSDEEMDGAGEGRRLGEVSSPIGSPSAFQEQEAGTTRQIRPATSGKPIQQSIEDEGIDMADKPTHTPMTSSWNFANLDSAHDSGAPVSLAGSIATDEAQHDSSGDERALSPRPFDADTDVDIPGTGQYELGAEPVVNSAASPLTRKDMTEIWDQKEQVHNVMALGGDQHSEEAAEIHLDEDGKGKQE